MNITENYIMHKLVFKHKKYNLCSKVKLQVFIKKYFQFAFGLFEYLLNKAINTSVRDFLLILT